MANGSSVGSGGGIQLEEEWPLASTPPPSPPSPPSPPLAAAEADESVTTAAPAAAPSPYTPLLEWGAVQAALPWSVILLLGGGFALADACRVSGLSESIGQSLAGVSEYPPAVVTLMLLLIVSAVTTVTSNAATSSIFLPVVSGLAQSMRVHPLSLMVPVALCCSLAFVLPVSTPPNAMAFASGRLQVRDMVYPGLCMNLVGVAVIMAAMHSIGVSIFQTDERPLPGYWVLRNATEEGG